MLDDLITLINGDYEYGYFIGIGKYNVKAKQIRWQYPPILEGVTWKTVRNSEPATLDFTVVKVDGLEFNEGDLVVFFKGSRWGDVMKQDNKIFFGRVFEKKRNKDHHIQVTAYDATRYFSNPLPISLTNVTASELVKCCCSLLNVPFNEESDDSGYRIPKYAMLWQPAWDIINGAIDQTVMNTKQLFYVYHDPVNGVTIKNIRNTRGVLEESDGKKYWKILRVTEQNASDIDYSTSIDKNTYNQIMVVNSNEGNKGQVIHEKSGDGVSKWGILIKVIEEDFNNNTKLKAETLLKYHNQPSRSLTIQGVLGDLNVKAGSCVQVQLNLGDRDLRNNEKENFFLVEEATHTFNNNDHFMELKVVGANEYYE